MFIFMEFKKSKKAFIETKYKTRLINKKVTERTWAIGSCLAIYYVGKKIEIVLAEPDDVTGAHKELVVLQSFDRFVKHRLGDNLVGVPPPPVQQRSTADSRTRFAPHLTGPTLVLFDQLLEGVLQLLLTFAGGGAHSCKRSASL